jgi:hypothetical protein
MRVACQVRVNEGKAAAGSVTGARTRQKTKTERPHVLTMRLYISRPLLSVHHVACDAILVAVNREMTSLPIPSPSGTGPTVHSTSTHGWSAQMRVTCVIQPPGSTCGRGEKGWQGGDVESVIIKGRYLAAAVDNSTHLACLGHDRSLNHRNSSWSRTDWPASGRVWAKDVRAARLQRDERSDR